MLKKEDQLSKYKQHLQGIYASRAVADIWATHSLTSFFCSFSSCFCCSCCFPLLFCLMPKMRKSRHKKWKCETAPAKQQQQQEEGHKKAGRRKGWRAVRGGRGSGNAATTIRHKNCESVYKFNFPAREFHIIKFFKCKRFKATLEKGNELETVAGQRRGGAVGFKVPKKNGECV